MKTNDKLALKEFMQIPGVGKSIAKDLLDLGYRSVSDLINQDPEKMYEKFCVLKGCRIDRCMLYVFRLSVYYASNTEHDPELVKWWNWKDRTTR
jgi:hypothetical protein